VQHHGGGLERQGRVGNDALVVPAAITAVVDEQHVVGEIIAEAQLGGVGLGLATGLAGLRVSGVHFEESFSVAILDENHPLSIGHILPNQWLVSGNYEDEEDSTGLEKLERSIFSIKGGIHAIVFHDNLKSIYKQLCRVIGERYNIPVFKHKTLKDLDRTVDIINGIIKI